MQLFLDLAQLPAPRANPRQNGGGSGVDFSILAFFFNIQKCFGCIELQIPVFYSPFQPNVLSLLLEITE